MYCKACHNIPLSSRQGGNCLCDNICPRENAWTLWVGALITSQNVLGAYWKFQTNMLVLVAIVSGAGRMPAVFKEGLLEAGPTLQEHNIQLPRRGHFFRAGSRKKLSNLPVDGWKIKEGRGQALRGARLSINRCFKCLIYEASGSRKSQSPLRAVCLRAGSRATCKALNRYS